MLLMSSKRPALWAASGVFGYEPHGLNLLDGPTVTASVTSMHLLLGHLQDQQVLIHPGKSIRLCVPLLHTALNPLQSADPQITGTCTLGALGGGLTATGRYYDVIRRRVWSSLFLSLDL